MARSSSSAKCYYCGNTIDGKAHKTIPGKLLACPSCFKYAEGINDQLCQIVIEYIYKSQK